MFLFERGEGRRKAQPTFAADYNRRRFIIESESSLFRGKPKEKGTRKKMGRV